MLTNLIIEYGHSRLEGESGATRGRDRGVPGRDGSNHPSDYRILHQRFYKQGQKLDLLERRESRRQSAHRAILGLQAK